MTTNTENAPRYQVTLVFEGFLDVPVTEDEVLAEMAATGMDRDSAIVAVAHQKADLDLDLDRKAGISLDLANISNPVQEIDPEQVGA